VDFKPLEQIKRKNYISTKGKSLISSDKGRELISLVNENVKSPEMTGKWEMKLSQVEAGNLKWKLFMTEIETYVTNATSSLSNVDAKALNKTVNTFRKCPKCSEETLKVSPYGCFCDNPLCGLKIFSKQYGKKLTPSQLITLIDKGQTKKISGFMSKKNKKYSAVLILDNSYNVKLSFD
jgi:DNA topoisomerase-3